MRQAVIVGPDRFEVREAPHPQLREPGEILVRTLACGLCSGDLMPWYLARKVGSVLGHEPVGRVEKVGVEVEHVRAGDLVFVHHHAPCLTCADCRREAFVHCQTWKTSRLDPGGMAERIRVPAGIVGRDCFAVNDLTAEQALFIEPLGCSVKALNRLALALKHVENLNGAIIGCGIMGLLNVAVARGLGVGEVFAVEPDTDRRQAALAAGAARALTPEEAQQELRRALDFVVIGPGRPEVIGQALELVRPAGVAIVFGPTAPEVATILDLGDLYFRELSIIPSYSCGPDDTRTGYELLRQGLVRPERWITHRFALDEVQAAYDTARRGGPVLKVIVTMEGTS
jgi:L-iditol 2-dehydrogenase